MLAASEKINTSAQNIANPDKNENANMTKELVTVKKSEISYEANATMLKTNIEMSGTLLDILDDQ